MDLCILISMFVGLYLTCGPSFDRELTRAQRDTNLNSNTNYTIYIYLIYITLGLPRKTNMRTNFCIFEKICADIAHFIKPYRDPVYFRFYELDCVYFRFYELDCMCTIIQTQKWVIILCPPFWHSWVMIFRPCTLWEPNVGICHFGTI